MQSRASDTKCEFRSAVVFYGGVSLAIYENGVARAFYDAVRGRGVFGPLLDALSTRFVVDVISGSSAGGINGLLLAASLETEYGFEKTAKLWRVGGGFEKLLRPLAEADTANSLLHGEGYYYGELRSVFHDIYATGPSSDRFPKEMDVFVTGTDLSGQIATFTDALDSRIDTKDHRIVFHLKHRSRSSDEPTNQDRKRLGLVPRYIGGLEKDDAWRIQADVVASVARITSSFPAAFPPFAVSELDAQATTPGRPAVLADAKERVRGSLSFLSDANLGLTDAATKDHPLIDGGVLDNKPFGHVLRAIFHRAPSPTGEPVKRRVFYIEPDPAVFDSARRDFTPLQVALASLVSLPSYDSIAADVRRLREHNAKVLLARANRARAQERWERLQERRKRDGSVGRDALSRERYMDALAQAVAGFVLGTEPSRSDDAVSLPAVTRQVVDWARAAAQGRPARGPDTDDPVGEEAIELLRALDLDHPLRRLSHVLYTHQLPESHRAVIGRAQKAFKLLRDVWVRENTGEETTRLNEGIQTRDLLRARLEKLSDYVEGVWYTGAPISTEGDAGAWLKAALDQEQLGAMAEMAKAWLRGASSSNTEPLRPIALVSKQLGKVLTSDALDAWNTFPSWDEEIYPAELAGNIYELDDIDLIRIAPQDVRIGGITGNDKVAGDVLGHFSAFLRKDWRTNDIAWGHCDGLDRLIRALLKMDDAAWRRFSRAVAGPSWIDNVRATVQAVRREAETPAAQAALGKRLTALETSRQDLVSASKTPGPSEIPREIRERFTDALVALAQTAAASEYVDDIVGDGVEQDAYWGWPSRALERKDDALEELLEWKIGSQSIEKSIAPSAMLEYGGQGGLLLWGMIGAQPKSATPTAALRIAGKVHAKAGRWLKPGLRTVHFVGVAWRKDRRLAALAILAVVAFGLLWAVCGIVTDDVSRIMVGIGMMVGTAWILDAVLRQRIAALATTSTVVCLLAWGWLFGGGREFAAKSLRRVADAVDGQQETIRVTTGGGTLP